MSTLETIGEWAGIVLGSWLALAVALAVVLAAVIRRQRRKPVLLFCRAMPSAHPDRGFVLTFADEQAWAAMEGAIFAEEGEGDS